LDSLGFTIEHPLLGLSVLEPSLVSEISVAYTFDNSLQWHSRSEIEWSHDVESESLVVTLGLDLGVFVLIDNSPSLIGSTMSLPDDNFLSFNILSLEDIDCLLVLDIDEVVSSVLEDLPPS
jgi:hypothetical protein